MGKYRGWGSVGVVSCRLGVVGLAPQVECRRAAWEHGHGARHCDATLGGLCGSKGGAHRGRGYRVSTSVGRFACAPGGLIGVVLIIDC